MNPVLPLTTPPKFIQKNYPPQQITPAEIFMYSGIHELIESKDRKNILTDEVKENMAISLHEFVTLAIDKFIAGQNEHGGDLRDRNLINEMRKETVDHFWYNAAQTWPAKPKN